MTAIATVAIALVLRLDGQERTYQVAPATTLAAILAQHIGCAEGVCGACTVLVDGVTIRSCLMLAVQAQGLSIQTIDSLSAIEGSPMGALTPLQRAFSTHRAFQCGWCVPGMLVGTAGYLRDHPGASRADLESHFAGHLCRCLGGARAIEASLAAMEPAP